MALDNVVAIQAAVDVAEIASEPNVVAVAAEVHDRLNAVTVAPQRVDRHFD